jgi:hypothetical protein
VEANVSFQSKKMLEVCFVIGLLFICASCGGSNSLNTPPLSIRLKPSTPTLAVNSSIYISATTTPSLPEYYSTMSWSIQGYQSQTDCTEAVPNAQEAPSMLDCPNGWLAWEPPLTGYTQTGVYYYGPVAPGTYQVLVQGTIADPLTSQSYQGNASVTVTVAQ